MNNKRDTMLVAHWYAPEEVKAVADYVGDSLGLVEAVNAVKPKRLVFAGVKFMAETAKVMLPDTEIIIPDFNATCSLVTQTNVKHLRKWRERYSDATHIMYINSSVEMKALADVIVTSSNVNAIVQAEVDKGNDILFSPDVNMGRYLNHEFNYGMLLWNSVCEVHDEFDLKALQFEMRGWTDGPKFLLAHPESKLNILDAANFVGSTGNMLKWIEDYPDKYGTIWVATEGGLINDMRTARPELDIRTVPAYNGCICHVCPYMKLNTMEAVQSAIDGLSGTEINYLADDLIELARRPIERMLDFNKVT